LKTSFSSQRTKEILYITKISLQKASLLKSREVKAYDLFLSLSRES